jgi:transcriptional regulator with XRE-family HTH domain
MSTGPGPAAGESIGQRLKRLRLEHGLSQRELASPGVSYAYISRIEAGTRQPSVKALRRLAAKLGVPAEYLETGSQLDPAEQRELRLADLELAVRLSVSDGVDEQLQALVDEAILAGDRACILRGRVALASLALESGQFVRAVDLLEAAIEGDPFLPVERFDIYANLGRAYAASGRPDRAVDLYERCIQQVREVEGDSTVDARYATLLSYALSDMGELARAEEVVREALDRVQDSDDPYMRVRLYWSMARLAHAEGEASVALANARKAIALLQATDDSFHLARAHMLAASISLSRDDTDSASKHLDHAEQLLGVHPSMQDSVEIKILRSRIAASQGDTKDAIALAREALELVGNSSPVDEGLAFRALADGLALSGEYPGADEAYRRAADLLEAQGRWRDATEACRAWARLLRTNGHEEQALDVLDRATELGLRAAPAGEHAER